MKRAKAAMTLQPEQTVAFRVLNGSVTVSGDRCVHCGACTAVCSSGALSIEAPDWALRFRKDKCYVCQLCVKACPVRAIAVSV